MLSTAENQFLSSSIAGKQMSFNLRKLSRITWILWISKKVTSTFWYASSPSYLEILPKNEIFRYARHKTKKKAKNKKEIEKIRRNCAYPPPFALLAIAFEFGRASIIASLSDCAFASMMNVIYCSSSALRFPLTPTNGCEHRVIVANEFGCIQLSTGNRFFERNELVCLNNSSVAAFGTLQTAG